MSATTSTSAAPQRSAKSKLLGVAAVVLVVVGGGIYAQRARPAVDAPPTFAGNVDIRDVTLAFRVGGRVAAVLKKEGDRVQAGEVLARLDPAPYRAALLQSAAAVEVAQAQLRRIRAGSRQEDLSEVRAMLAEREAARLRAEDNFARAERLRQREAVAAQTLDDARAARDQGRAAARAAAAAADRVQHGARAEDIAITRAQLAQAEAAMATAELSLADTELKAPTAGVVVTRVIEPGAVVGIGAPTLVIALDDPVWIRAFASERELARLAPGTAVEVYTDARPGQPYHGQVGYVSAQSEFTPKNVETAELRTSLVYRFRVIVDKHDGGLRQGMPVTVRLASPAGAAAHGPSASGPGA